ncbi:hypothetical protein [Tepidimicrobium xylanilyticum]
MITKSEVYLDNIKISNIENHTFDQMREFLEMQYIDSDSPTNIPSSKSFTFNFSGKLSKEDAAHATFLDMPEEPLDLELYEGGKSGGIGFLLSVYVENCSVSHTGGDGVTIDVSFRPAGPASRITL